MKRTIILFLSPIVFLASTAFILESGFLEKQKKFSRVRTAIKEAGSKVESGLKKQNLTTANFEMLLLAFKAEDELQLFVRKKGTKEYTWLHTYPVCAKSGALGPKRRLGDGQVPEGFYHIDRYNPSSNFYLSLGLNYPNASDKKKGGSNPGGDIFIHGNCVTIGCLPMTDPLIKEIYLYAVHARNNGQNKIPVYVFPFKMTDGNWKSYSTKYSGQQDLIAFWSKLKPGFDRFIANHQEIPFSIDAKGNYVIN